MSHPNIANSIITTNLNPNPNPNLNPVNYNSIEIYNALLRDHMDRFPGNQAIFNLSKCCGYSEFLTEYNHASLADLYRKVKLQFETDDVKLFTMNPESQVLLELPKDPAVTVRQFIHGNQKYFKAQFPVPAKVVYKLLYSSKCHCAAHGHI